MRAVLKNERKKSDFFEMFSIRYVIDPEHKMFCE